MYGQPDKSKLADQGMACIACHTGTLGTCPLCTAPICEECENDHLYICIEERKPKVEEEPYGRDGDIEEEDSVS